MTRFLCSILLLTFIASGCSQPKSEPVTTPPTTTVEPSPTLEPIPNSTQISTTTAVVDSTKRPTGEPPTILVATAAAGTAQATFEHALIAFQEGRLEDVFDLLPASHQADAERLMREFARTMDSEIWSSMFATLSKLAKVMKSKKPMIEQSDAVKRTPAFELVLMQWDQIANGIQSAATSDISSLDRMKRLNLRALLASSRQFFLDEWLPKFGHITVTTMNSDGNQATLSYRESQDGEPIHVDFFKVDGKWLPKSIADGWSGAVRTANAQLEKLPSRMSLLKPKLVQYLQGINGILDKLQTSNNADEFNTALIELMFSFRLAALVVQESILDTTTIPRKGNDVRIEVNRELKEAEQTSLRDAVFASRDGAAIDFEMIANDGKTRFRFAPFLEIETMVEIVKKQFDGANVRTDSETKTIYVELK